LLGRALIDACADRGLTVLAQYHSHIPEGFPSSAGLHWIGADFADGAGVSAFLLENRELFQSCRYLINNYGPICDKPFKQLRAEDFMRDYHHNVAVAFEITRYLLDLGGLQAVVNIGFHHQGEERAYQRILTYAAAKNALLLMTRAFARAYPETVFDIYPLPVLEGARVIPPGASAVSPADAAGAIMNMLLR